MGKKYINEQEAAELQGEGGSDVFTTTRHINYNQPETKRSGSSAFQCKVDALKFWSNDDSPVIRPAVLSPKWPKGYNAPIPPKGGEALRYGECERVTVLMARSNFTKLGNFLAITCLGALVFGGILALKGSNKKIEQTSDR